MYKGVAEACQEAAIGARSVVWKGREASGNRVGRTRKDEDRLLPSSKRVERVEMLNAESTICLRMGS